MKNPHGEKYLGDSNAPMPCNLEHPISDCPHMKAVDGDLDMDYEHYFCKLCQRREKLDYDEMR